MYEKRSIYRRYHGGAVAQVAWVWRVPRCVTVLACLIPPFPHLHSASGLDCHFSKPWCSQVGRISRGASKPKCFLNSFQFNYSFHANFEARVRTGRLVPLRNVALTSSGPAPQAAGFFSITFRMSKSRPLFPATRPLTETKSASINIKSTSHHITMSSHHHITTSPVPTATHCS